MKSTKLLLVAFAAFAISSIFSCSGGSKDDATNDSTKISNDQVIEQTIDSTAVDTLKK